MNNLVSVKNGKTAVSSKQISEVFGKPHKNVIRDIEKLRCSDEFRRLNFEPSSYTSPQNKKFACFDMTKDGFVFLCMGFTGAKAAEWKEKYILSYNKMESYIRKDIADASIMEGINIVSSEIDKISIAGSVWGKTGSEIRKRKLAATTELSVLINKAQMQLGFGDA